MWMHEVQLTDGTRIHAYKHWVTRRYMHLAADGRAFEYCGTGGHYREIGLATAIVRAFDGWEQAQPPAEDVQAMLAAVRSARRRAA
jgi:hypothetical protein